MNTTLKLELPNDALHHTYIVVGEGDITLTALKEYLSTQLGIDRSNPNLWIKSFETLKVEDIAEISSAHQRKSVEQDAKKIIILQTTSITQQAQNSLLKMLEEPTANTHFFIILPTISTILPTVLSRAHVIRTDIRSKDRVHAGTATTFLHGTGAERLVIVAEILSDYDKEKISREDISELIYEIEHSAYTLFIKKESKESTPTELKVLKVLTQAEEYVRDTSSSLKLILEYLALELPKP